jgi:streptomycin 6-kinase
MANEITIPHELRKHVAEGLGDQGHLWLNSLTNIVRRIEADWSVEVGEPFAAGEFNFVAPATSRHHGSVVVKIAPPYPDSEFFSELAYLKHQNGRSCVRVLAEKRGLRAMMLERAVPGKNLVQEFTRRKADSLAPAIECLHRIICDPPDLTEHVIYLDKWFDGLRRYAGTEFPHSYAEKALLLYEDLSESADRKYIHGDFHPGNIVTAQREPYLAIDPKGIVGFIGYDIAVFLNTIIGGRKSSRMFV